MLALNPRKTALVVIDLQQGIVGMSVAPHPAALVIANSVALARGLTSAGGTVVLVRVAFAANGADRLSQPVEEPMRVPAGGPPPGWSDLVPEVAALQHDVVIVKHQWSAFYGTDLDLQLRRAASTPSCSPALPPILASRARRARPGRTTTRSSSPRTR
ncbi:MAG TPA: isochorismatase family protein [Bauldia sp.]